MGLNSKENDTPVFDSVAQLHDDPTIIRNVEITRLVLFLKKIQFHLDSYSKFCRNFSQKY